MPGATPLKIRAATPGRVRWDVASVRDNPSFAQEVETRLRDDPRLDNVVVSIETGRVLVEYDPVLEPAGVAGDAARAIVELLETHPGALRQVAPSDAAAAVAEPVEPENGDAAKRLRNAALGELLVLAVTPVIGMVFSSASPFLIAGTVAATAGAAAVFLRGLRRRHGPGDAAATGTVEHLAPELREHRKPLLIASALTICSVIFSLSRYVLVGRAVDAVLPATGGKQTAVNLRGNAWRIVVTGGLMVIMTVVEGLFELLGSRIWRRVAIAVEHRLRLRTFAMLQRAEMGYLQSANAAELRILLVDDVAQIDDLLSISWDILHALTTMAVVAAAFLVVAPGIAWICMLGIPITLLAVTFQQNRLLPRQRALRLEAARLHSSIVTSPEGLATIKSFAAEKRQLAEVAEHSRDYGRRATELARVSATTSPIIELSVITGIAATVIAGGLASGSGLTVGQYSMMIMMSRQLLGPLALLGKLMEGFQRSHLSLRRLFRTLDLMPLEDPGELPLDRNEVRGRVKVRNVHFRYEGGREVLHDVSLDIRPGKTTAIVGPTGSGKSTLLRLLVKFHQPASGTMEIERQPIAPTRTGDLRRAFAFVSQEVFLFPASIRDNIAFARPDASQAEIERAARIALAHEFIERLPDGYETNVGEHGLRLSGGERQRIAIARALVADAPILVLDEATSQLDNETENRFYESLRHEARKKTKIVVAHRLAAARTADWIYVLEDGRVCEEGTHAELVERGGLYATLWHLQVEDGAVSDEGAS